MNLPTQFGPYLLLERISVGGMAEVYKAKEYGVEGFERTVAVKRILPHVAEDDEFIAMFKDEAKIAVQLNHGNIAQIYNLGNEQDSFYIALEYINGRDLRAIFQKCQQQGKPMPVAQACYVIMKICEGLDYAHNKKDKYHRELNIVHRDVSPPNILVSFEGEVKLIDFGVAKAAGRASRTQAGILKGKFGYMSPEQVRGMPLDRRSDVFSVGVVLFEVLSNTRLFQAETDFATLEKVRAVEVPRPSSLNPDIPKPLENIIYKALAREPEQRYQSGIELHDELQAFMFAQGLFYSRKDLAAWMRQQYAREIELEKEKSSVGGPPPVPEGGRRKTLSMPTVGGPPPAPTPGAKKTVIPPPPPPRPTTPRAMTSDGGGAVAATPTEDSAAEAHMPRRSVKRKTMVMTTARPNIPPPPGGGPPKPRPRPTPTGTPGAPSAIITGTTMPPLAEPSAASSVGPVDPPTVPSGPALPRPNGAKPKPTQSYATTPVPSGELDWDDDELETRLFDDDRKPSAAAANATRDADRPAPAGGVLAPALIAEDRSDPPTLAAPTIAVAPDVQAEVLTSTQRGLTVVPSLSGHTMVAHSASPFPSVPAMPQPMPLVMAPPAGAHPVPVAPPPMRPLPAVAGPPQAQYDYDGRPARGNAGLVVGLVVAVVALVAAGFGGVYLITQGNRNDPQPQAQIAGEGTTNAAVVGARSGVTIHTTPADVQLAIDGQIVAGTSPFVVSDLQAGKHKVTITRDGYLPFEREIDVAAAGLNLPVSLEHRDVTLVLETDPPGAQMNLVFEGRLYAIGTGGGQYILTRSPGSSYQIEASAAGYLTTRADLAFSGETTQRVKLTLPRDNSAAAAMNVPSTPATGPADPPGSPTNPAPTANPGTPIPGTPAAEPTRPRAQPASRPSKPRLPKPPKPPAEPSPASMAKTATLKIGTNPGVAPAEVSVDGKAVGTTPIPGHKVTPGKHKVKWKWPDGSEVTVTVDLGDGETKVVKSGG